MHRLGHERGMVPAAVGLPPAPQEVVLRWELWRSRGPPDMESARAGAAGGGGSRGVVGLIACQHMDKAFSCNSLLYTALDVRAYRYKVLTLTALLTRSSTGAAHCALSLKHHACPATGIGCCMHSASPRAECRLAWSHAGLGDLGDVAWEPCLARCSIGTLEA